MQIDDMQITTGRAKMKKQGKGNKKINGDAHMQANHPTASEDEQLLT